MSRVTVGTGMTPVGGNDLGFRARLQDAPNLVEKNDSFGTGEMLNKVRRKYPVYAIVRPWPRHLPQVENDIDSRQRHAIHADVAFLFSNSTA